MPGKFVKLGLDPLKKPAGPCSRNPTESYDSMSPVALFRRNDTVRIYLERLKRIDPVFVEDIVVEPDLNEF